MCFNTLDWDAAEVERHMRLLDNPASSAESKDESRFFLSQCIQKLWLHKSPVKQAINDEVRKELDAIYVDKLGKDDTWKYFGTLSPIWLRRYEEYTDAVVSKLDEMYTDMIADNRIENMSDEVKHAWENCASKANMVLRDHGEHAIHEFVPFMSASVWTSLSHQLKRIPTSLLEVSYIYRVFAEITTVLESR